MPLNIEVCKRDLSLPMHLGHIWCLVLPQSLGDNLVLRRSEGVEKS